MEEYGKDKHKVVMSILCTIVVFFLIFVVVGLAYLAMSMVRGVKTQSSLAENFKPQAEYSDSLTVPVEQEIIKVNGGTIKEPMKNDFGNFYESEIKYNVYVDNVKDTVFAEIFVGRTGLLINLVDADGSDKLYSSEDLNQLTAVSINEDGLFYILEDVDTGVQYIVSRYNSYLIR